MVAGERSTPVADSLLRHLKREAWVLSPMPDPVNGRFPSSRYLEERREGGLTLYRFDPEAR